MHRFIDTIGLVIGIFCVITAIIHKDPYLGLIGSVVLLVATDSLKERR